jgi:hypothetical protein
MSNRREFITLFGAAAARPGFRQGSQNPWRDAGIRPNQENVRSTTQRRGKTTKPFMSSLRLTISRRSGGTFATPASTCHAL